MSATHLSGTSADQAASKRNDTNDTNDTADTVGEAAKATPRSSATRSAAESVLPEPAAAEPASHSETSADRVADVASASRDEISSGGSADRDHDHEHVSPRSPGGCSTETVECPPGLVGRVIGKGGETIKGLQAQSGARVVVDQNFPEGAPRVIGISGPPGCVAIAKRLVEELLRGGGARLGGGVGPGQAQQSVRCPKEMVGRVIGRGGETVKGLQAATGARIQIDQSASPCVVTITGNPRCVDAAARAVADVVRGGSTAAYGAANQRREAMAAAATYRRRSLAHSAAAYGDARFGASRIDARFAPRDPLDAHAMARFHSHSMAQLEHQFASMGYHGVSHPTHGTASAASGGVPMEGHPRASAALYGFAGNRAPAAYGYGPGPGGEAEYAYGGYGGDPAGALYAMQMQAQMQAQMQVGQMGGMHAPPVVLIPGQPVTTAQIAAQARPPPAEMTLAQIAAQQNAEAAAKKTAKPKKTPKAKAAKKDAAGAGNAPMQTQPAAPPAQAPQQQHVPQRQRPQGAPVPLREQDPADIVSTLKTNLDLIRREFAENLAAAAARGEEFQPPSFQVRSQHDAAVGIELWLQNHAANFNKDELAKKVAMMRAIQEKCRRGMLDPVSARNKIESLACWVELTKTYYICARESRNLKLRGVQGIQSPTFRLPDTTKQIPPPRPPEDFGSVAELDVAMGQVCGAQTWVAAVEKQTAR